MWYPTERQWNIIFFVYAGAAFLILAVIPRHVLSVWPRIFLVLALGVFVNAWRHSRKYPPH